MCACCHICSHCDSYTKRRCRSCSSTYLREPSSVKSYCRHHRWTCPCCCRKYFRSHSVCGLFPNNKSSDNDEYKLYQRHLTGHYLKLKSSSVTDLYSSYDLSQKTSDKRKRRGSLCGRTSSCRKSRRDTYEVIPGCSPRILKQLDVDYKSYKSFVEIPLTYCPTCEQTQHNNNDHMCGSYCDYLNHLKRSIYSFKDTANTPNELFGKSFLNDLNKLYATVGGGMEDKQTQKEPIVSSQTQTSYPNPVEAMQEYRSFFGRGHKPKRYSNLRRSQSYRRRSRVPTRASSMFNVGVQNDNWPLYNRMKYSIHLLDQKEQDMQDITGRRSNPLFSDFVLKYPTRLGPTERVRLSMTPEERHAIMGSLILSRSSKNSVDFDSYERRHTIHMEN